MSRIRLLADQVIESFKEGMGRMKTVRISKARSYDGGYKYCSNCSLYYLVEGKRCPYCRTQLRTLPRRRAHIQFKRVNPPPEILNEASEVKVKVVRRVRGQVTMVTEQESCRNNGEGRRE